MANTKETVIIKIENLSGYLQGLIKGLSKNPNEGYSVMATYDKERANKFTQGSEELETVEKILTDNHIEYSLIVVQ